MPLGGVQKSGPNSAVEGAGWPTTTEILKIHENSSK